MELGIGYLTEKVEEIGVFKEEGGHRGPSQWWQGQGFSLRVEEGASSRWI